MPVLLFLILLALQAPPAHTPVERWLNSQPLLQSRFMGSHENVLARTATTSVPDCFRTVQARHIRCVRAFEDRALGDGTVFEVGPAKEIYNLFYDPDHRIVWFSRQCCAWAEQAMMSGISAPPHGVAYRNLLSIATYRGVALGSTLSQVERAFGKGRLVRDGNYRMLLYRYSVDGKTCVRDSTFVFHAQKVVAIDFWNGC
jgi:hypothetical protein